MEPQIVLNEETIPPLLERFYGRVRADPDLGPIFNGAVADWPEHLARLHDFWSSVMLGSGRYKGSPVAIHLMHAEQIGPSMFARWLALWKQTTDEMLSPPLAVALQAKADRIAESLQLAITYRRLAP
jgi:hemoglobin